MNWAFWRNTDAGRFDPTVQLLRGAAADAQRSRLPQMAAALSYRTIFGLLPILAVGLWILHRMVTPEQLEDLIGRGIDALGLSTIAVDTAAGDAAISGPVAEFFVGPPLPPMTPAEEGTAVATASLKQWITDLVARINNISFGAIGMVGVVMLIYAAISMIVEIERAFNQIFRVPRGRSWIRRVVNYWTLITLGAIGLLATFAIQQQFGVWVSRWTGGDTAIGSGAITLTFVGYATQWLVTAAILLLLYTAVPNTRVRFMPALAGAVVAAAIFEAGKFAFAKYVEFSAGLSYARLYGSLALIPLFLLWVYFSWLIVLFGVQLTYQIQHGRARTHAQPIMELGPSLVEPTAALTVMTTLARAFAAGGTLDAPAIAARTRLADPVVRLVLARVCERGLVHRIENTSAPGAESVEPVYTLARPRHSIRIAELLEIGFDLAAAGGGGGGGGVGAGIAADGDRAMIDRLHRAQIDAAGSDTLADVPGIIDLADPPSPPGTPAPDGFSPALLRAANGARRAAAVEPQSRPHPDSPAPADRVDQR